MPGSHENSRLKSFKNRGKDERVKDIVQFVSGTHVELDCGYSSNLNKWLGFFVCMIESR